MAGRLNLVPEKGEELSSMLQSILNGEVLEAVQDAFAAVTSLGDNNIVDTMRENFNRIQNSYNNDVVPASKAVMDACEQFTDMAKYVNASSTANSVKDVEVGKVQANNYDAAKDL